MKRIYNFIILSVWALLTVCCSSEEPIQAPVKIGDEVTFALSLEDVTRTVYGNLEGEANNKAYPIYWTEGDKVQIYSPQCLQGRNNAEYKVVLPDAVPNPNYAEDLQKTGSYGIQWGESATANFYSLYPSGNYTMSTDGKMAEGINIAYNQNIYINEDKVSVTSFMDECIMYAQSKSVTKGDIVNLQYKPVTTTFMLTLNVPSTSKDDFMIQSISLATPSNDINIAGDFSIDVEDGTFGTWGDNKSNSVTAQIFDKVTGGFFTLAKGNSITIPLFIAPVSDLTIDGWYITVVTDKGTYKKTLKNSDTKDGNGTINAGDVHRITLPNLATINEAEEWDPATWMVNIPRNVYLSEISIPGTWNSLNTDCQSDLAIKDQYSKGVRAFHIDTRWRADNKPAIGSTFSLTKPDITKLSVAVGGSNKTYKCDDGNLMRSDAARTFEEYLGQITSNVKEDEYMIVFCTFAQNSYNGDRCPSTWYKAISDACDSNDKVYDASILTHNTLVGDVLNHVIVVVNLDSSVDNATLPEGSKCLFTYVPMQLPSNHYDATTNHIDELHYATKASSGISMYTSHAQISTTGTSSVNCGDRGYSHPLTSRNALVESFWDWSKSNYGTTNYKHDKWIYLGLGGYIMTTSGSSGSGYDTVEELYAQMVYNRIDEMGKNDVPYYPMGIILMNNKKNGNYTDLEYGFSTVCKKILLLNNMYRLQYSEDKPSDYNPNAKARSDYDGSLTSGGNAIQ